MAEKKKFYVVVPTEGDMGGFCDRLYVTEAEAKLDLVGRKLYLHVEHVVVEHEFSLYELAACHEEIDGCTSCDWHTDMWEEP